MRLYVPVLLLFALVLVLKPLRVESACCMAGADGIPIKGIATCADGPCPPGLGQTAKQSDDPNACCDRQGNAKNGFTWNGPKGTPGCKWPGLPGLAISYPCTGKKCDPKEPTYRCQLA